ncbi:MAG: OmpA family protein [Stenotrophobium sp.]
MNVTRTLCIAALGLTPFLALAQPSDGAAPVAVPPPATAVAAAPAPEVAPAPTAAVPAQKSSVADSTTTPELLDDRWSIWPMIGGVVSDATDLDRGLTGGIRATRPFSDHFVFSGGVDYSALKTSHAKNYDRLTGRLGVELFPGTPYYDSSSSTQPYIGVGGQASSVKFLGERRGAYGPWASVGFQQRLSENTSLRLEALYQIDYLQASGSLPRDTFYTWQFMAGLRIALGHKPGEKPYVPPPPPPPVVVPVHTVPYVPPVTLKCPNTPAGIPIGPDGCPLDSDNDGVPDYLDECPHTPAGAKVLPNGCALKGDCRTPKPGEAVDAHGCAANRNFILKGVKFEFDSARLTPDSKVILNQVADTLNSYPDINVDVEGHTDYIGSDAYNMGLSERRADAVKDYLVSHGVAGKRMTPIGYGKTRPIASNETAEGREQNRRVELHVKDN